MHCTEMITLHFTYLAVFNAEHNIPSVMSKSMNANRNAASVQHVVHSTLRGTITNFLN